MLKKILILLSLLNLVTFAKIHSDKSRINVSREIIGDWVQRIEYSTGTFKITGFGNRELSYKIENFGNIYFFHESGAVEELIKINNIELISSDGSANIDKNNQVINSSRGQCNLKVIVAVNVNGNTRLGGKYKSKPITLVIRDGKDKSEEVQIEINLELNVIRRLRVSTTPMDLGVGVQGQKMSSNQGTHGYLKIEGEPNREVEISYPKDIEIFNKNKNGRLKVKVHSPELGKKDDEDYEIRLTSKGERKVTFVGEVEDTKKAPPGSYSGELKIKVRYD